MKRFILTLLAVCVLLCSLTAAVYAEEGFLDGDQYTFTDREGNTVTVPVNAFASRVIEFIHGDPWRDSAYNTDPQIAIGLPDADSNSSTGDLCLGCGGILILGFESSIYDGPGNDIYVFEVGGNVEETLVEVSDDLQHWYEIGVAEGRTAGLDIFGKVPEGAGFRYVRLTDTGNNPNGGWPGADIDTVCGLNTQNLIPRDTGDVNGDDAINAKDIALLQRYVAGWAVLVDETVADVNRDGAVNAKDIALLQRYVAKWDVTLG